MKTFSIIIGIAWFLSSHIWVASYWMFDSSMGLAGSIFSFVMGILYLLLGIYHKD